MADGRPASPRGAKSAGALQTTSDQPVVGKTPVGDRTMSMPQRKAVDPTRALIAEFIQPAPSTMAWLSDPRLTATLQAASDSLAPGGVAEDAADRYAASVLETHLVARRRLTKLTNSLLKT